MPATLIIHTDEDRKITASPVDAPGLFNAFAHWRGTQSGSTAEAWGWCYVLSEAGNHLNNATTENGAGVIEVTEQA